MFNKILKGALVVILLIVAVEGGYYWAIRTRRQASQPPGDKLQTDANAPDLNQGTATTQSREDLIKITQRSANLNRFIQESETQIKSGDVKTAIETLIKASAIKVESDREFYSGYVTKTLPVPEGTDIPLEEKLKSELSNELGQANLNDLINQQNDLAKFFYRLGLIAYRNNRQDLVDQLWTAMVNSSPEWSHFQLELANYYLATGNLENAKKTIKYCSLFNFPGELCLTFQEKEIKYNLPHPVGYLRDRIASEVVNQ